MWKHLTSQLNIRNHSPTHVSFIYSLTANIRFWFMWLQYLYNTLLQTCGLYFLFYDIARGIGSSNGRFTSFAQSLESAYKYKAGHYDINNKTMKGEKSTCKTILKYIYRCIISTFLKFGPGTIVSIALGLYPTWTKGPRHIYSYYIAFFVIQLLPRNNGFLFFYNNILSRILMHTATALYKLRKLIFILQASTNGIFIIEYFFLPLGILKYKNSLSL